MSLASVEHIVVTPGTCGGRPRIAGRRITVENIALWHVRFGHSVDEIAEDYELSLAEIYAALAYYFDHRQEIDASIEAGEAFAVELRSKTPSLLAQKLAARLA